jgi:hypothetical protein
MAQRMAMLPVDGIAPLIEGAGVPHAAATRTVYRVNAHIAPQTAIRGETPPAGILAFAGVTSCCLRTPA